MQMLDKGRLHMPGMAEQDGLRFHHAAENSMQFTTYELSILELTFPGHSFVWAADTTGSETMSQRGTTTVFGWSVWKGRQRWTFGSLLCLETLLLGPVVGVCVYVSHSKSAMKGACNTLVGQWRRCEEEGDF